MFGCPVKSFVSGSLLSLLVLGIPIFLASQETGPQSVRVPRIVKPAGKPKVDRSSFPPVPMFKDIASEIGVTASHIAAPEAHYVIDSTSGGTGLFDCDDDGRLDILLVNGSTVERLLKGGDPMVTLYHQEADGSFKDITAAAGLTRKGG